MVVDGKMGRGTVGGRLKAAVIFETLSGRSIDEFWWQRACIFCGGHSGAVSALAFAGRIYEFVVKVERGWIYDPVWIHG
jgi:hypothetical protein